VISTGAFVRALAASRPPDDAASGDPVTRHRPALPEGEVKQWLDEFGIAPDAAMESVAAADPRAADPRRAPIEHEPPAPQNTPETDKLDDDEVARWLREFGVAPDEPIDPRERQWWEE
jgi:hypothetical protein